MTSKIGQGNLINYASLGRPAVKNADICNPPRINRVPKAEEKLHLGPRDCEGLRSEIRDMSSRDSQPLGAAAWSIGRLPGWATLKTLCPHPNHPYNPDEVHVHIEEVRDLSLYRTYPPADVGLLDFPLQVTDCLSIHSRRRVLFTELPLVRAFWRKCRNYDWKTYALTSRPPLAANDPHHPAGSIRSHGMGEVIGQDHWEV